MSNGNERPGSAEHDRVLAMMGPGRDHLGWRRWGPYVSERSWASVREDYSPDGEAWDYLPHERARSTAYRWGEDGIAGICDRYQVLVFAPAFWNGRDSILKERLFGVTPHEGNHGEDVKEYYYHSDNTPSHSYMRYLYRYPQREFPYLHLVKENQRRAGQGFEYELLDTGVLDEDRYWDITIEYAKVDEEDIAIRIEATNRGPEPATLHVLPQLWFRNTWSWGPGSWDPVAFPREPWITLLDPCARDTVTILADDSHADAPEALGVLHRLGPRYLHGEAGGVPLFTDNETNHELHGHGPNRKRFTKDAIHRQVVNSQESTNPDATGTKAALHYVMRAIEPGKRARLRLRLTNKPALEKPLEHVDTMIQIRKAEADAFYGRVHPPGASEDERRIQRQALAGLLWTKQVYLFDVHRWLDGDDPTHPPPESRRRIRNQHWLHLNSARVMTVCDTWEYPWFAAWDLAFHCVAFALVDPQYAKDQLWVLLFEQFQHPNGQIPAYEWEFSDLNPPVHAWAVWRVYHMDADFQHRNYGEAVKDRGFLERCYHKLLINFAWWINKVDRAGNNIFEGGFLGLDNITVVDRSTPCGDGAVLEQADATGWMGMFCLNLMRMALELAVENPAYESMATKFFQHYAYVAAAMKHMGGRDYALWDEKDGFFYDVLRYPTGEFRTLRVRSMVGLIPLFAVERLEADWVQRFPEFQGCLNWFLRRRSDLTQSVVHPVRDENGDIKTHVLTIVDRDQLQRLLERVFDPREFLSDYGVRSLSKAHQESPFVFDGRVVAYEPAESESKLKGGNSNWRGPVWFPTNFLLIESLRKLGKAWGQTDGLADPCGGAPLCTFRGLAEDLANRLIRLFTLDESGRRPVFGGAEKFQTDPGWRDELLFYEYFHGDNGAGLGASHQTGWTALIACLIDEWRKDASPHLGEKLLHAEKSNPNWPSEASRPEAGMPN